MELKYLFASVLIFLWSQNLTAQDDFPQPYGPQPEIGKPMPEFTLNNVKYFSKTEVSLKDFKGNWLFLDFWFTGCAACVKSFPKVNSLQLQFKDEVQFLLVGINEEKFSYGKGIESMYEKYAVKQNLVIAAAFDSTLVFRWGLRSFPHIIIIDPDGIVRSITNGMNLNAESIKELIRGEPAAFFPKDVERSDFDPTTTDDNKYVIYRSVLTKWNGEKPTAPDLKYYLKFKAGQKADYQIAMVPLYKIYNVAHTGSAHWTRTDSLYEKVYPYPVLEMKDTSHFDFSYQALRGLFNFSIKVRDSERTEKYLMQTMRTELETIFGYVANIEMRPVPVWKLVAMPGAAAKLKTKGGTPQSSGGAAGFTMRNINPKSLLDFVARYLEVDLVPFFDETGIKDNIDMTLDALMTNPADISRALNNYNLDLILDKKEMLVIVIKDKAI